MIPQRIQFWQIQSVWLFYFLASVAIAIFIYGIICRLSVWKQDMGRPWTAFYLSRLRTIRFRPLIFDVVFGSRIFKGDISAGVMHLMVLWGFCGLFIGTVLSTVDHHLISFLEGKVYLVYSVCLEISGLVLMIGILWALIRRYIQRVSRLENRFEDLIVAIWLLVAVITGFFLEMFRIQAQNPDWAGFSFVAFGLTKIWPHVEEVQRLYVIFWWVHAVLSLGFISTIPFTKLFHVLAAPASIYLATQSKPASTQSTNAINERLDLKEIVSFDACTRCGRCADICPSSGAGEPFSPRDFITWSGQGVIERCQSLREVEKRFIRQEQSHSRMDHFTAEKIWHCTTCRACLEVCPVYVGTPEVIRKTRSWIVEDGKNVPTLLIQALENLYKYNNPWGIAKKKRADWSEALQIPDLSEEPRASARGFFKRKSLNGLGAHAPSPTLSTHPRSPEQGMPAFSRKGKGNGGLCYFVGCTTSLDTRTMNLATAFAQILKQARIPFGTLGKKEPCCGDIARCVGEFGLFEEQRAATIELFQGHEVREVVTSSPHCFHTFQNTYPVLGPSKATTERFTFRVRHYTQILEEVIRSGALRFSKRYNVHVTYHDPCYLGRYNRIYDAPRNVIKAVPGIKFAEMAHHRDKSLCCGGGGGRMWLEGLDAEIKMSEIRIQEAAATHAEILITSCPLCLIMLEDARKTAGMEEKLQILDLNEFVIQALGVEKK